VAHGIIVAGAAEPAAENSNRLRTLKAASMSHVIAAAAGGIVPVA